MLKFLTLFVMTSLISWGMSQVQWLYALAAPSAFKQGVASEIVEQPIKISKIKAYREHLKKQGCFTANEIRALVSLHRHNALGTGTPFKHDRVAKLRCLLTIFQDKDPAKFACLPPRVGTDLITQLGRAIDSNEDPDLLVSFIGSVKSLAESFLESVKRIKQQASDPKAAREYFSKMITNGEKKFMIEAFKLIMSKARSSEEGVRYEQYSDPIDIWSLFQAVGFLSTQLDLNDERLAGAYRAFFECIADLKRKGKVKDLLGWSVPGMNATFKGMCTVDFLNRFLAAYPWDVIAKDSYMFDYLALMIEATRILEKKGDKESEEVASRARHSIDDFLTQHFKDKKIVDEKDFWLMEKGVLWLGNRTVIEYVQRLSNSENISFLMPLVKSLMNAANGASVSMDQNFLEWKPEQAWLIVWLLFFSENSSKLPKDIFKNIDKTQIWALYKEVIRCRDQYELNLVPSLDSFIASLFVVENLRFTQCREIIRDMKKTSQWFCKSKAQSGYAVFLEQATTDVQNIANTAGVDYRLNDKDKQQIGFALMSLTHKDVIDVAHRYRGQMDETVFWSVCDDILSDSEHAKDTPLSWNQILFLVSLLNDERTSEDRIKAIQSKLWGIISSEDPNKKKLTELLRLTMHQPSLLIKKNIFPILNQGRPLCGFSMQLTKEMELSLNDPKSFLQQCRSERKRGLQATILKPVDVYGTFTLPDHLKKYKEQWISCLSYYLTLDLKDLEGWIQRRTFVCSIRDLAKKYLTEKEKETYRSDGEYTAKENPFSELTEKRIKEIAILVWVNSPQQQKFVEYLGKLLELTNGVELKFDLDENDKRWSLARAFSEFTDTVCKKLNIWEYLNPIEAVGMLRTLDSKKDQVYTLEITSEEDLAFWIQHYAASSQDSDSYLVQIAEDFLREKLPPFLIDDLQLWPYARSFLERRGEDALATSFRVLADLVLKAKDIVAIEPTGFEYSDVSCGIDDPNKVPGSIQKLRDIMALDNDPRQEGLKKKLDVLIRFPNIYVKQSVFYILTGHIVLMGKKTLDAEAFGQLCPEGSPEYSYRRYLVDPENEAERKARNSEDALFLAQAFCSGTIPLSFLQDDDMLLLVAKEVGVNVSKQNLARLIKEKFGTSTGMLQQLISRVNPEFCVRSSFMLDSLRHTIRKQDGKLVKSLSPLSNGHRPLT